MSGLVFGAYMSAAAQAADEAAAARKLAIQCAGCHGVDGVARMPGVPHLAGQDAFYLERQLKAFRSGERQDPQMNVVAKNLDDQGIADLAAWYSSIKVTVQPPK